MDMPKEYYLDCPACEKETEHEMQKGEVGTKGEEITIDGVFTCSVCGHTRHKILREKNSVEVPIVISWKNDSKKDRISLYPDEWVHKGDELICDGVQVQVTSIEQEGNKRTDSSRVEDIETLWTKKHEKERVKVTMHKGNNSISDVLEVVPHEEFFIGDQIEVGKYDAVIHRIKTEDGLVRDGKAEAEDIVRIYSKKIR